MSFSNRGPKAELYSGPLAKDGTIKLPHPIHRAKMTVTVAHYNRMTESRNKLLEHNERLTKVLRAMRKHFIMRKQTITDLRKDHHIDCAQQVGWSIGCNCFMSELMAEVDSVLGIMSKPLDQQKGKG